MRTYEESCTLLDGIVGRCVRDAEFAASVLADPETALQEYQLNEDEMDDFRALRAEHPIEAGEVWNQIRTRVAPILNSESV